MQKDEAFLFEQDHRGFAGWLRRSAIVAALFTIAVIAIVFGRGPLPASPISATAATAIGTGAGSEFTSSTKSHHSNAGKTERTAFGSSSSLWVLM